jgi:hypothetical protein
MYAVLAAAEFRRYATYRQTMIAAMFTNSVFGFLRCFVLLAVSGGVAGGVAAVSGWLGPAVALAAAGAAAIAWKVAIRHYRSTGS